MFWVTFCFISAEYDPNTGTARAAILWRRMIDRDPLLAAQSSMYWRNKSANDPKRASKEALQARKTTAQDPEGMLQKAFLYRSKRQTTSEFQQLTDEYWRVFAANDPEISARFSMYWATDPEANMYW